MELKNRPQSLLFSLVIIPMGGCLALGLCYLLFLLLINFVESTWFPTDPLAMPVDVIRRTYTIVLLVLLGILLRTRLSDLFKAAILIGPVGIFLTTLILAFYQNSLMAAAILAVLGAAIIFLLYRLKKPWMYYYAVAIVLIVSIALAWP